MKASNVKLGQLIKTEYGLATVMKFWAPKSISCIIVATNPKFKPGSPGYKQYAQGEWINIQGFDFDKAEIIENGN
jgi:hypothetical protein